MAVTPEAHKALQTYVAQAASSGPAKGTIRDAIILTSAQRDALTRLLTAFWGRQYPCPALLDIKPQHGYRSRVGKDGFSGEQYVEWLVAGCSDIAAVRAEQQGRPGFLVVDIRDHHPTTYDLIVPIRSDALGYVHVDDVIPKGLPPRHKKTAPSALP